MSYRIYLSLFKKDKFQIAKKAALEDEEGCGKYHMYIPDGSYENIDIYNEAIYNIKKVIKLKKVFPKDRNENPAYLCSKKAFEEIIKFYAEFIHKDLKEKYEKYEPIKDIKESHNDSCEAVSEYRTMLFFESMLFERACKNPLEIQSSSLFKFDYFFLLHLYKTFDFKNDVAVLTHG